VSALATETPPADEGAGVAPPAPASRSARWLRTTERVFLVGGLVLLVVLIRELGAATVLDNLRLVGWGIVPIIAQEVLAYAANTVGWLCAFAPPRPRIGFAWLFGARLAGDAINYVTPTATIGGEFVRGRMIEDRVDPTAVWASVAVAKITQTVAQVLFIIAGLLFVATRTPLPAAVRHGLLVSVPLFAATILGTILLQRRGLFTAGVRLLRRLRVPVPASVGARLGHLDDEIRQIYATPGVFLQSTAFFFLGWMCGVVEIYVILHFLEVGASWERALSIEALSVTVDGLFFFVPAKAGTQEGGKVLIFTLLGLDPAKGLTLGIVRRTRELTWAGIGLLFLSRRQLGKTDPVAEGGAGRQRG